jgi:L-threonylcarbamoyladenylate synthase
VIVLPVDPGAVDGAAARRASEFLKQGGIVALRTDTVYGLLASVNRPESLKRLRTIKQREPGKPFLLLALDWIMVRSVTTHLTPVARRLGARYWPGPLTLVLPGADWLPDEVKGAGPTVAVRVPADPMLREILKEMRSTLAAPSANLPNRPPAATAKEVGRLFGEAVGLVLDGGEVQGGVPSTIVDCTRPAAEILREGAVVPTKSELASSWDGA